MLGSAGLLQSTDPEELEEGRNPLLFLSTLESSMNRVDLLKKAIELTSGDRDREYGSPFNNLGDCATLYTTYLIAKYRGLTVDETQFALTAEDLAHFNVLQKMARTFSGVPKPDTYTDGACYFAIAGECAALQKEQSE